MTSKLLNNLQSLSLFTYFAEVMKSQKSILALIPVTLCYLISIDKPFFWDTTHLASAQAQWFYNHGLNNILLPDSIDSGHPPFTGWLLAVMWNIFGKGLVQSHLLMLPFLVTALWQMLLVLKHYFPKEYGLLGWLFFFNPILLTQSMLVSPDIILFAGFFTTLHGILNKKYWKIVVGSVLLSLVSMRGMVCVASLAVFGAIRSDIFTKGSSAFTIYFIRFLPSTITGGGFLLYHFISKGWIGYHTGSPWAPSFAKAGLSDFFRNLLVLGWRFVDQGMIFIWLFPLWILFRKRSMISSRTKDLLILFAILLILLATPQLFYNYLLMHRYLYPCIAILTLAACSVVIDYGKLKNYVITTVVLLISGLAWIYPDNISKGWDIMPLHYSYYTHRASILEKMKTDGIDPKQTGAGFPYETASSIIDLSNDSIPFAVQDINTNPYILYSNISNDFSDETIRTLKSSWTPVARSGRWPVYFILYKRPTDH